MDEAKENLTNSETFESKTREVSKKLGIPPEWLMVVMHCQSRIDPNTYTRDYRQGGLIQFDWAWAYKHGTSVKQLVEMAPERQLDFVFIYFEELKPVMGYKCLTDFYLAALYKDAIGKPDYVIYSKATDNKLYNANIPLDKDYDKDIDWPDIDKLMRESFEKAYYAKQ